MKFLGASLSTSFARARRAASLSSSARRSLPASARVAALLALALLSLQTTARAQVQPAAPPTQVATPAQELTPAPTAAPQAKAPAAQKSTPRPSRRPSDASQPTPRAPQSSQAPHAPKSPPSQTPAPSRPAVPAPAPPQQVVTVVHRMSGWRLLTWFVTNGPSSLELDEFPSASDAHTNIVAGYVTADGKTVLAHLPRAEAELESMPSAEPPPGFFAGTGAANKPESDYKLVTADGRQVGAKFVGLDASTGLSLLEASESILPAVGVGAEGHTEDPTVGQRVRLYAPTPAASPSSSSEVGYVYLSIDQKEGHLTQVRRAPSGKPFRVVARANVTPEWTGAVAANEFGEVVGIVSQSGSGETQIVPVGAMLAARERVLKLRGSAPQPWLGVRGDAAFRAPLETWVGMGWRPESAMTYRQSGHGVFLTAVAPGTPAALAGFRPGDLISRVGSLDVRSAEDLSYTLNEAGVGSTLDFTVIRSFEPAPLKFSVQLTGAQNPALATAEAEGRAARAALNALRAEVSAVRDEERRLREAMAARDETRLALLSARLTEAEERIAKVLSQVALAESRMAEASAPANLAPTPAPGVIPAASLRAYGLHTIGLTLRSASRLGARGGLLVVAVRPESPAHATGLRPGDVIETLGGRRASHLELRRLLQTPGRAPSPLGVLRSGKRVTLTLSALAPSAP